MKKTLVLLVLLALCSTANAQNFKNDGTPYYFYCEMTAMENMVGKLRLTLEWDNQSINENLRDEKGNKIEFASVVDMINFMSKRGWDLTQTYDYKNVVRFLFRKLVKSDEEAKEGLYFKSDKK